MRKKTKTWRDYSCRYTKIPKEDLIRKLRKASKKMNWRKPMSRRCVTFKEVAEWLKTRTVVEESFQGDSLVVELLDGSKILGVVIGRQIGTEYTPDMEYDPPEWYIQEARRKRRGR